jgi:serine/threonine protein kinase
MQKTFNQYYGRGVKGLRGILGMPRPAKLSLETKADSALKTNPKEDPADEQSQPSGITPTQLEASMMGCASEVKLWDGTSFTSVQRLQEAVVNGGFVDMMRSSEELGSRLVAVKRMPNSWVTPGPREFKEQNPTARERPWYDIGIVRELNKLKYAHVCELVGVYRDFKHTYVVTSLATEGDLFGWCEGEPAPGPQREAVMKPLAAQIFVAVRHLHELGVAHRNLSLENIVLTDPGGAEPPQIKLIDFGMCTLRRMCQKEVRGKQSYQAPEMHTDQTYDLFLTDDFAVGVVLFAMAAQDYPWASTAGNACKHFEFVRLFGLRKLLEQRTVSKGNGEHLIEVFSPAFVDVVEGLMQIAPAERFSLGEACFSSEGRRSAWEPKWLDVV